MTEKKQINIRDVKIRSAEAADAKFAGKLLYQTFPHLASFAIGLGNEERAKANLAKLFRQVKNRFSYEWVSVAEYLGRKLGIILCLPGKELGKLDLASGRRLLGMYKLRGKIAVISRLFPMAFMKEAGRDEYLLSNIAVLRRYQGHGVGQALIKYAEEQAKAQGYNKCALMVDILNTNARRLYECLGYKIIAVMLESNKRVKNFGPGYYRMVKVLA